ncbi:response regulator transcription factor [Enterococcus camelliae]|uniref:Response regulator transcription factor n=1 Tax=Enterococcus camelliae TaxID=453959 RepID=A0ABW5TFU8_9ENTE
MVRILVIDDDADMLQLIKSALEREGYAVDTEQYASAITIERCRMYQLLLVDVMMSSEDGFSFVKRVRHFYDGPILFLTAKTEMAALTRGFELGADDYIKKPFELSELRARVAAHLRRENRQVTHAYLRDSIRFDLLELVAFKKDERIPFTKSEFAIAEHLSAHPGQVYTKEQLYEAVFGLDASGDATAITEHVKNIRAKLKLFHLKPIETVWGVGYKWKRTDVR